MEISEFAKQILLSSSLEEKLVMPAKLTDRNIVGLKTEIHSPTRAKNLQMGKGQKLPFPKTEHLSDQDKKAQVFHFFANHELLAMELMALTLLKFPDAPKPFRRGIAQAMMEEQEHMRLYLTQLKKYGLEFGDLHLNDFFWKSLSPINSVKEFVVKMSLTFEQANLDFSKHFMLEFNKINDTKSFEILKQVYEDEIGHVKLGVHWFNKWKDSGTSFWDAYNSELQFPLTPERGKGKYFDRDGRKKAGLDEEFIENIFLYNTSKERPPRLWLFNPEAEEELLSNSGGFTPNKSLQEIKKSLQHFLCISAINQDIIIVDEKPSTFYLQQLKTSKLPTPEYLVVDNSRNPLKSIKDHLGERKIISIHPWAHTQSTIKLQESLKSQTLTDACISNQKDLTEANSQVYSHNLLSEFLNITKNDCDLLIAHEELGGVAKNWEEVLRFSKHILSTNKEVVIKAPLALSGRGLQFIDSERLLLQYKPWVEGVLTKQGQVIIEPKLNRIFDYSLQLNLDEKRKRLQGLARFISNDRGRYQGGILASPYIDIDQNIKASLFNVSKGKLNFDQLNSKLTDFVYEKLKTLGVDTAIGVDCFVYRNNLGEVKVKPLVEINFRYNMGRLKVDLSKKIKTGSVGLWRVLPKKSFKEKGLFSAERLVKMQNCHPVKTERNQITEGLLWLSDPLNSGEFVACAFISKSFDACKQFFKENLLEGH